MRSGDRPADDPAARRALRTVLVVSVIACLAKIVMAATTYGTIDIRHWQDFVDAVARHGPVGVYGVGFAHSFYNHPPAIGYLLAAVAAGNRHGVSTGFSLRTLASLADVGTAVLVWQILRRRVPLRRATRAAVLVGASPVLVVISGFHGNTDPVFVLCTLLAGYLLVDRDRPVPGGLALALAISIKIVPVVVVPALLVYAWRRGPRRLVGFAGGAAAGLAVIWLPAVGQAAAVRRDVLSYAGSGPSQWGLSQLGHWWGDPAVFGFLAGSGRFLVVAVCALLPAALVWRRPDQVFAAVGLALAGFLFTTPAFGTQYLAWAVAAAYLLDDVTATVFNLGAGALLVAVYTRWNRGLPWDVADQWGLRPVETLAAFGVWLVLGLALLRGGRRAWRTPRHEAVIDDHTESMLSYG